MGDLDLETTVGGGGRAGDGDGGGKRFRTRSVERPLCHSGMDVGEPMEARE